MTQCFTSNDKTRARLVVMRHDLREDTAQWDMTQCFTSNDKTRLVIMRHDLQEDTVQQDMDVLWQDMSCVNETWLTRRHCAVRHDLH
jgi:hypothetical protein